MPRPVAFVRVAATLVLALVVGLTGVGCDHKERVNLDPARELWTASSDQLRGRTTELRARQQALAGRIGELKVPDGTEDAQLAAEVSALQGEVANLDAACATVERSLAQVTSEIEVALSKPDKVVAERTVKTGLASFEDEAGKAKSALDALTPRVDAAQAVMRRLLDGIAAEVSRLQKLASEGGGADFSDIDFQAGSAEFDFTHPASKATLTRLVAFAGSCDQLRFGLTGHTSREGKPAVNKALSLARATAVRDFLVQAGTAPAKITKVDGLGSAQTMIDEPTPGSPEEAAMAPDELETRRRKNRRVTVQVTAPCTTPVAPTALPPTAPPPAER